MDTPDKTKNRDRGMERGILLIYTLCYILMIFKSISCSQPVWILGIILAILVLCWGLQFVEFHNALFRINLTVMLTQVCFLVFAVNEKDISDSISYFIVLVIATGFYGVFDLLGTVLFSSTMLVLYHIFIGHDISFHNFTENIQWLLEIVNMYFAQGLVFFWVKKRQETAMQIQETIAALKKAEKSKDSFLINVSHEVRTPINTICGISEIILQNQAEPKLKEEMERIQAAGQNLISVVNDIMDFSELQSEKIKVEEEAYNISSTVNDVINMVQARKQDETIEFIVDCDADIPCVLLGDEKKIRRVLLNLLDNAIKFTKEGYICMRIRCRRESYGVNLTFTIIDTGIGMKEESLEQLFTSFNQVNTEMNRKEGGIGLGVNISYKLVEKMGGVMTVSSEYEKGSVFQFVVPQKVLDNKPIASINHPENVYVATYINMEQFNMRAVRDEYSTVIRHIIEQSQVKCLVCRSLAELKRRVERENITHIFISCYEYQEDKEYFDALSERVNLIAILYHHEQGVVQNEKIQKVYKPFYVLPIMNALNTRLDMDTRQVQEERSFIAPQVHVLVVDDNEMNIHVIQGLLQKYEIRVTAATSGQEALQKIETMDYDFVFMDHMMPEMDGIETFKAIRNKVGTYYKKVPIIALTANAVAGSREKFIEAGFQDFLEKPVERSVLERVLRRNIAKRKLLVKEERMQKEGEENIGGVSELLDMKKGYAYCGGKEKYMGVLHTYSKQGADNLLQLQKLYEQNDWVNYTIAIHGVKSFMASIGATKLSDLAKKLEMAGKGEDVQYIRMHHDEMAQEFELVLAEIKRLTGAKEEKKEETKIRELSVLSPRELERIIKAFEEAMYEFDETRMFEAVEDLESCVYNGVALKEQMEHVRRKVELGDYMSAMEMLSALGEVK